MNNKETMIYTPSGMTPADAMKMTNDKHVTGIQLNDDKL